jgi:hypothetical protein
LRRSTQWDNPFGFQTRQSHTSVLKSHLLELVGDYGLRL